MAFVLSQQRGYNVLLTITFIKRVKDLIHDSRGMLKYMCITKSTGHRTQDTGHRTQDTGHRTQDTGHGAQNCKNSLPLCYGLCEHRQYAKVICKIRKKLFCANMAIIVKCLHLFLFLEQTAETRIHYPNLLCWIDSLSIWPFMQHLEIDTHLKRFLWNKCEESREGEHPHLLSCLSRDQTCLCCPWSSSCLSALRSPLREAWSQVSLL